AGVMGLRFARSYNSINIGTTGDFGRGWTHSYERKLTFRAATPKIIKLRQDDGQVLYFQDEDGDLVFKAMLPASETSWIVKSGAGYTRNFRIGGSESYDLQGLLLSVTDPSGNVLTLSHDADGRLSTITDPGGRNLTLVYDQNDQLESLIGPQGPL